MSNVFESALRGGQSSVLCQKGQKQCNNIFMYKDAKVPSKYVFIVYNIGPEAMAITYQCEFTAEIKNLHETKKAHPTALQAGMSQSLEDLYCRYGANQLTTYILYGYMYLLSDSLYGYK